MTMATKEISRPIVSLMTQVTSDLAYLVQTEFRLARAEMGETLSAASNAGVYLAIGGVIALGGFIALLFDIASWITVAGLPYEWSLLIVAVVALAIGAIVAMAGASRMRASSLVPKRTLEQMRQDYVVAKEQVR
jgi:Putative Actinobacterial Holin-X, holin superfamily III